jgi:hypothetical protein
LSVALVDAMIKDADIIAIFRAVHHLIVSAIHNPFLSLPPSFQARPARPVLSESDNANSVGQSNVMEANGEGPGAKFVNVPIANGKMFLTGPDEIDGEWLKKSRRFQTGILKLGELLSGGRI